MLNKTQADFNNALDSSKRNVMSKLFVLNIGKILTYYPDTQTADVELMQVKSYLGREYPNAFLSKIPVFIYGSENAQITLPDLTGTICLIFTFDRNISSFMKTGESYSPNTARMHNLTDSIAFTTFFSLNKSLQNYDNSAISLIYNRIIEEIAYTAIIKNFANSILLKVSDDTNETNAQIEITDKINVQNTTTSLITLIDTLLDTIKAITISSNAVSPASQTALEDLKTTFRKLLK